jgi:hypothetical protein
MNLAELWFFFVLSAIQKLVWTTPQKVPVVPVHFYQNLQELSIPSLVLHVIGIFFGSTIFVRDMALYFLYFFKYVWNTYLISLMQIQFNFTVFDV